MNKLIVRKLRLDKGLSQEQLADMAGISTRTLQRIERGAKASPETLKCIASVLETEFGILREEQDMTTQTQTAPLPEMSAEEREAMEYVRDIKSFYGHAVVYGVAMAALLIVNLIVSPGNLWFLWAALGWGVGLVSHGMSVFEVFDLFGGDWEKRQIRKRMER